MAIKQFSLTSCERLASKAFVELEQEYVAMRNQISADILTRLGLPKETKLNILDLEKGIIAAEIPEPKEKVGPKLVKDIESEAPEMENAAPAQPE